MSYKDLPNPNRKNSKRKLKIAAFIAAGFLAVSTTAVMIGSNYLVDFALFRESSSSSAISNSLNKTTDTVARMKEKAADDLEEKLSKEADLWARDYLTEELSVYSKDNLLLAADYFEQKEKTNKYCIFVHGYHSSKEKIRAYAQKYYEKGYNVLTPDNRAHGESEGKYIGMGVLDKDDLKLWINKIVERDSDADIVLHGLSMGASTIMLASGDELPANVKVCIEDSGYSSVWNEFSDKLYNLYKLPEFPMLYGANLVSKVKAKYYFTDGSCVAALEKNKIPMLFIHGDADDYNPFYMLDVVYNADASPQKEKLVVKGARHTMSAYTEPEVYWDTVWKFIDKYNK